MKQGYGTLTPRKTVLPNVRFLSADEQAEYEETVKIKYNSKKAKKSLNIPIEGSNLFKVIELENQGIKVASLSELGLIVEQHRGWTSGFYIDIPSIALTMARDTYKPNNLLAKDLAKQLRIKTFKNPLVVSGLKLEESSNSVYGLKFKVTDKTEFYEAPELRIENNGRKFTRTDERGIPIFDENGNRAFYTGDGLSRLSVSGGGNLDFGWVGLAGSVSCGLVFVVDAEGTSQNSK